MTRVSITRKINVRNASAAPSWYSGMSSGEWKNFASSAFLTSGVGWSGTHPGGTSNFRQVIRAWCGGVLNTQGLYVAGAFVAGTWLVVFGGGHDDYWGNELYAFGPLESDTPAWNRLNDPTIPAANNVARIGGYPVSRHTYDTLVYLPVQNKMVCMGAPGYSSAGFTYETVDVFDFSVNPALANPWSVGVNLTGAGTGQIGAMSAYDSVSGYAWSIGRGNGQRLHRITANDLSYTSYTKDNPGFDSYYAKAAIYPSAQVMAFVGQGGELRAIDLRTPTGSIYAPSVTGTAPSGSAVALGWDSANGRFVAKAGSGKQLWFLTPGANPYSGGNAWAWSSVTPAGGDTPGTVNTYGYFGRFQVVNTAAISGVLVVPNDDVAVSFYKF